MPDEKIQDKVNEMLSNLGARVMDALRTGGDKFLDFDDKYARAVGEFGNDSVAAKGFRGTPIREMADNFKQNGAGFYGNDFVGDTYMNSMLYGGTAANLLSRYALPAGGAVLAAKGLADLTQGLYDTASDQPIL